MMIAKIETDSWHKERLLLYEKRIESSLYKAMNKLQKLQRMRKQKETKAAKTKQAIPQDEGFEAAIRRGRDVAHAIPDGTRDTQGQDALATETPQMKKQTQFAGLRPEIRSTKLEIRNDDIIYWSMIM